MKAETSILILMLLILTLFMIKIPESFAVANFIKSNSNSENKKTDTKLADDIYKLSYSFEKTKKAQKNYDKIMNSPVDKRQEVFNEIKKQIDSVKDTGNTKLANDIYKKSAIKDAQENYNKIMQTPIQQRQEIYNNIKNSIESNELMNNSKITNNSNSDYSIYSESIEFPTLGLTKKGDSISVEKLGIGTNNPYADLDIVGNNDGAKLRITPSSDNPNSDSDSSTLEYKEGQTILTTQAEDSPEFKLELDTKGTQTTALFAKPGYLGVGKSDPTEALDVDGNIKGNDVYASKFCTYENDKERCLDMNDVENLKDTKFKLDGLEDKLKKINNLTEKIEKIEKDVDEKTEVRYIRIEATPKKHLSLAEVEVIAKGSGKNIARYKPTTQGSTGWGGLSSRAVDGTKSGRYSKGSVTHTQVYNNWWEVDLLKPYELSKIIVYNRTDCCNNRLRNANITLLGEGRKFISKINYGNEQKRKIFTI